MLSLVSNARSIYNQARGEKERSMNFHLRQTIITNLITAAVGAGLALNRRRNREIEPRAWPTGSGGEAPYIQVIIPARNEESNIGPLLSTLMGQSYPAGRWGITVVDDGSTDGTGRIAQEWAAQHPNLTLVEAPTLLPGWTGKSHAMYIGALSAPPEAGWLLFVDADTRHAPHTLSSVVAKAEEAGAHLMSLVIDVEMLTFWERVLVPQVGELYTLLVGTMDSVNSGKGRAVANGQFLLIRRDLYMEVGSLPEVRGNVAEDRALAHACRERGYNVRLEYGRRLVRARVYSSLREIWGGYTKTLFWAGGNNAPKALAIVCALALYALGPITALLGALLRPGYSHKWRAACHAALQLLPMLAVRVAVCRQVGVPPPYALTYPLGVAVGDAMLLYSLYRVVSGKGVQWKGRTYQR